MTTPEKRYWFPAKTHGWGWGVPATWQGWVVLLLFLGWVSLSFFIINPAENWVGYSLINGLASVLFLAVCVLKGEPPKWRWGKKDK